MKLISLTGLFLLATLFVFAQKPEDLITAKEAERIEKVLAADDMKGRRAFSPEIDKAAAFIADEFKKAGLQTLNNSGTYLQSFSMVSIQSSNTNYRINNQQADPGTVVVVSSQSALNITERSGYEKVRITKGQSILREANKYINGGKNYLVVVDTSFTRNFRRFGTIVTSEVFKPANNVVFVLSAADPSAYSIAATQTITEKKLANVVGILPGKSKKNEYVIFSGHYDHIGTGKPAEGYPSTTADTIYNGANDDAAGTTAVILLAKYFSALKNNERTLVFATFTAEELGGFGAQYFSKQFDPAAVMAMFNIEMIGTESKWGRNSAYITGYEKTDMGAILQKNLEGTGFTFHPDPYPDMQLFYRSDNATLARLGVPAHTISTSKMDVEPHYHKASDEVATLDMENMAMIIKSIAMSSRSIISGAATPSRVKVEDLR